MAIITEYYTTRIDGVTLNRTYSDTNMMIEREGVRYEEAIDPTYLNRQYIETDIPIEHDAEDLSETEEKALAFDIITGVSK